MYARSVSVGERISGHLRSNIVGYIALFIALTAGAYAAGLKKNSVKSKHIKDGQVLTQDLGNGAVTPAKLAPGAIPAFELADGSVTNAKLAPDAVDASKVGANALGGADVDEASLTGVDAATVGGTAASGFATAGHDHNSAYVNEGQADSVNGAMIEDTVRTIQLPLKSFIDCDTDAGAEINFASAADPFPDFVNRATDGAGFFLRFDATGGSPDEDTAVCSQVTIPDDRASADVRIFLTAEKAANTGAIEQLRCGLAVNGGTPQFDTEDAIFDFPATYAFTTANAGVPFSGDVVTVSIEATSPTTMNDAVDVLGASVTYVARQ